MMPKETYSVEVDCSNCEQSGTRKITKGMRIPALMECPHCGCKTARKKQKSINYPYPRPYKYWEDKLSHPSKKGTTFHEGYSDQSP